MFCNKCGAQCADDAKFCINCGNELPIKKVIPVNEDAPAEQEVVSETVEETPEISAQEVNAVESNVEYTAEETKPFEEEPVQAQGGENSYNNSGSYDAHYNAPPMNYAVPPYQYGVPPIEDPYKNKAKAGMICGIVSLVVCVVSCCTLCPVTLILSIFGIVFSAQSINKTTTFKNQATAGLTCSIIALVLSLCMVIVYAVSIAAFRSNPDIFNEYSRQFSEEFGDTFNTFISNLF